MMAVADVLAGAAEIGVDQRMMPTAHGFYALPRRDGTLPKLDDRLVQLSKAQKGQKGWAREKALRTAVVALKHLMVHSLDDSSAAAPAADHKQLLLDVARATFWSDVQMAAAALVELGDAEAIDGFLDSELMLAASDSQVLERCTELGCWLMALVSIASTRTIAASELQAIPLAGFVRSDALPSKGSEASAKFLMQYQAKLNEMAQLAKLLAIEPAVDTAKFLHDASHRAAVICALCGDHGDAALELAIELSAQYSLETTAVHMSLVSWIFLRSDVANDDDNADALQRQIEPIEKQLFKAPRKLVDTLLGEVYSALDGTRLRTLALVVRMLHDCSLAGADATQSHPDHALVLLKWDGFKKLSEYLLKLAKVEPKIDFKNLFVEATDDSALGLLAELGTTSNFSLLSGLLGKQPADSRMAATLTPSALSVGVVRRMLFSGVAELDFEERWRRCDPYVRAMAPSDLTTVLTMIAGDKSWQQYAFLMIRISASPDGGRRPWGR